MTEYLPEDITEPNTPYYPPVSKQQAIPDYMRAISNPNPVMSPEMPASIHYDGVVYEPAGPGEATHWLTPSGRVIQGNYTGAYGLKVHLKEFIIGGIRIRELGQPRRLEKGEWGYASIHNCTWLVYESIGKKGEAAWYTPVQILGPEPESDTDGLHN
jgi:hypothetical protein